MGRYIKYNVPRGTVYVNAKDIKRDRTVQSLASAGQLPTAQHTDAVRRCFTVVEDNPTGAMAIRECSRVASYHPFLLVWWPTAPDDIQQIKWGQLDGDSHFILRRNLNKLSNIATKFKLVKIPGDAAIYRLARFKL